MEKKKRNIHIKTNNNRLKMKLTNKHENKAEFPAAQRHLEHRKSPLCYLGFHGLFFIDHPCIYSVTHPNINTIFIS